MYFSSKHFSHNGFAVGIVFEHSLLLQAGEEHGAPATGGTHTSLSGCTQSTVGTWSFVGEASSFLILSKTSFTLAENFSTEEKVYVPLSGN
jgi:hypothetical protein